MARPSSSTRASTGNTEGQLIRQVEDAITRAAVDDDEHLQSALKWHLENLTTFPGEPNRAAIIRLAVEFLHRAGPRASARDALIGLAREDWDVEVALDRWEAEADGDVEGDDGGDEQDDEGQPPSKKRRLEDSDEDEEDHDGGRGDAKGKGKEKGKGKAAER